MDDKKYLERQDIVIEGNEATWECRLEGDVNGTYTGRFRFRCFLLPTQKLAAAREMRALLGENATLALAHEENLAYTLSQLKHRVISAPPFWTSNLQVNGVSGDLPDENIIDQVLEAAIDAELKFRAQLKQKKIEAIEKAKKAAERILKLRDEQDESEVEEDRNKS
jgi:hypothetical protein